MKNNLKTKSFIVITIILIMITFSTMVNAADNYSVGMSLTSDSKLKEGDTVTIKVNLSNVNAGNGIDTITASLKYDTNVFETLETSNLSASNDWTPSYAASTNMLTLLKNSKVTSPETVLTITLKVRSLINVDSTTVTLENIIVSGGRVSDGGTGDITVSNASVTISKEKEASNSTQTSTNNTISSIIKDNTVTSTNTLPKTGIQQYALIAIIVVAVIAIFSYVLYKKIAKDVK